MKKLVENLIQSGALKSERIIEAFLKVDRKDFVPERYADQAYFDHPLPIGFGQTISQPTTVAFMLELLEPQNAEKILDVGSGSGWTTALLAQIVGEHGQVTGVEIIPDLVFLGQKNLAPYNFSQAKILQANSELGNWQRAPYDKILVSASAKEFPKAILRQLKTDGVLVIPIGNIIYKVIKKKNGLSFQKFPGFAFVPLIQ